MADTTESPSDLIMVKNFSLPDASPARMSRESYELSFKGQGFEIVDNDGNRLTGKTKTPAGGNS